MNERRQARVVGMSKERWREGVGKKEGGKYDAFSRRREKRKLQASLWGLTGEKSSRRLACRKETACRENIQCQEKVMAQFTVSFMQKMKLNVI